MGFETGTSRLLSERATTELRRLMSTEWIKVHLVFTCSNFRNLPVACVRCSKINLSIFVIWYLYRFAVYQLRSLLTVKSLQNVIHEKLFCYIYQVLTGKFLKIAQVKTRWTFIPSVDISLRSSVVASSLCKGEVPGSNPTVGKNFTFCNSRSTRDPHSFSKPMRMKSTMTFT